MAKRKISKTHPEGWKKTSHPQRNAKEVREYTRTLAAYFAEMQLLVEAAAQTMEKVTDKEAVIRPSVSQAERLLGEVRDKLKAQFQTKAEAELIRFNAREAVRASKRKG